MGIDPYFTVCEYGAPAIKKLISELKIKIPSRARKFTNPEGSEGRINKLRKIITALVKHERIELNANHAVEARGYAERELLACCKLKKCLQNLCYKNTVKNVQSSCLNLRTATQLITEAVRYGDTHVPTMRLTSFWLVEEQLHHKLFKVLVPRYKFCNQCYTRLHRVPINYADSVLGKNDKNMLQKIVLELKGNPFPPMPGEPPAHSGILTNILLEEARRNIRMQKAPRQT